MHNNCRLFPDHIVCTITQRNNMRRASTCNPALKLLNKEITSDILTHLDAHWDHRHNTHILWKTIQGLSNRAPPSTLNTSLTFNNKITTPNHIANCFNKQFTNTQHTRQTDPLTNKIQGYNITHTTTQVKVVIKITNHKGLTH